MNIGLIGSGGREHTLCYKISESKDVKQIFCFPGNAGTSKIANNVIVDILNFKELLKLIKFYKIDITNYLKLKNVFKKETVIVLVT